MKYKTALIFFSILFPFAAFSQLSGSYTIGGISPDYTTISAAFDDLKFRGVSGPVVFNVRDGMYYEINILMFPINGISSTNNVTIQSESRDSSQVVISDSSHDYNDIYPIFYLYDPYFTFKQLTLIDSTDDAIEGGVSIYNCIIKGNGEVLRGMSIIQNCIIQGDVATGNSTIENNVIYGSVSTVIATLKNNIINGELHNSYGYISCFNNLIYGSFDASYNGGDIENNTIRGGINIGYNAYVFKNNLVYDSLGADVSIGFADNSEIANNEFHLDFACSISFSCKITGNKFYSYFGADQADGSTIINNFYFKSLEVQSNDCQFIFNNCITDSNFYFFNNGTNNIIENNTMPSIFYGDTSAITLKNNNYGASTGGTYDRHPFHINPDYISPMDLHAKNPQLMGRAIFFSTVKFDIDSLKRPRLPTIGANEICFSHDTMNAFCGDSIILSLCNMPVTGHFQWTPATGINNTQLQQPTLKVINNGFYSVKDSASGYIDSLYINIIPYVSNAGMNDSIKCGDHIDISATFNAGAVYRWSPTDSLSTPGNYFTDAHPAQTTTYVVDTTVPGCASSSDTITIFVNSLPTANFYLDSIYHNYYSFHNTSTCADTYLWDFGDTTYSTTINPIHIYKETGNFLVTLVACNSYGCDTTSGYVNVDSIVQNVGVPEIKSIDNEINIYPNLNIGRFTVSLNQASAAVFKIYNFLGEMVNYGQANSSEFIFNLSNQPNGIYLLRVSLDNREGTKQIIINR